ncbi:uncharacterized protein LOC110026259 isoform X2 [Phalaenopsis equestris]|uniref:uncharacterized protein LOC110026259 isoform X2 n=1 Tax=Phalaenopsis equestris TaxID=78828 RepID=UPI0009E5621F|nr:uncharacterized protein LOC110026259 isoform X2 [Phalaenopsis equestris]
MRVPEKEGSMSPYWLSSTNWLVADGSLDGSISFETSINDGGDVIPIGVLLESPADSPPCEITVFFRERHELHSIYVRSSARVYEIYHASDGEVSSNEYLCTVRCGTALQEVRQDMCERASAEYIYSDFPRSNSNNFLEDGWVEVEVPDSLLEDNRRPSMSHISVENICPKTKMQYEATAEISDASPCMSITLRLLSLQNKTSIHIDEIYIYADPVEDIDPDPPVSNIGASSLLSMIVPSLLQLSKSGTSRFQQEGFSDVLEGPKSIFSTEGAIHAVCPNKFEVSEVEASSSMLGNSKVVLDQQINEEMQDPGQPSKAKTDENNRFRCCVVNILDEPVVRHTQPNLGDEKLRLIEEEKGLVQSPIAINKETNAPYVRLEQILNDLVSRMGKLETYCISFQESMLKPLAGIEMRLQRMEEQLDALSKVPVSSETYFRTKTSCLSDHDSNFENEGVKSSFAAVESTSHEKEASVDLLMVSSPESEKISGLVVKAPEFPSDDDDSVEDESNTGCSIDLKPNKSPQNGKCNSIDSALASALAAFVTSTTDKSSLHNSLPMDVPSEQQNCDDHFLDSVAVAVHSEADRISVPEWFIGDKNGDVLDQGQDEMRESVKTCSDVVNPNITSNEFDMIDGTGAKVHGNYLSDESILVDEDDSSAEIETHESNGFIIRAPEFPNKDDILDCGENSEPNVCNYPSTHSHTLPHSRLTPLALYLSSRKVIASRNYSKLQDDQLELSSSDRSSLSLTSEAQGGSTADSSLLDCFLSQGGSPQQLDIFHATAVIGEESSSTVHPGMEDADHVLKCDGFHSHGTSKVCPFTHNLLLYNGLHTDRSSICIQDKEFWVSGSELRIGKFEAAGTPVFEDIFLSSKLLPQCYDSNGMDSFIGDNSGNSETVIQCQSLNVIKQTKSLFKPMLASSFIPNQDDSTTNVEFSADKNLRSWLPLEILLDEKQEVDPKKDDLLKFVQESSVDGNLRSGLLQLDKNPDDQVENSDYGIDEYNIEQNSKPAHGFRHNNYEIAENNLLDIEDNVVQFEMAMPGTPQNPASFSSENITPSLI